MRGLARILPISIVASAIVALAVGTSVRAADQGPQWRDFAAMIEAAATMAGDATAQAARWIETGYQRRPALMIGLGGILLLPPLALLGLIVYRKRPEAETALHDERGAPALGQPARLEIEGARIATGSEDAASGWAPMRIVVLPAGRNLLQIGRLDDNDICIEDDSIHRYHAVIERSPASGYTITDISGPDGNGLIVNGQRRATAMLADGDTVEIGNARMRFATAA